MARGQQIRPVGPVTAPTTLVAQIRAQATANVAAGIKSDGPVTISVVPASFKAKDGSVVVGVRLGRHFLVPEHVEALLDRLGVEITPELAGRFAQLFS
jgi:hypothetical protein